MSSISSNLSASLASAVSAKAEKLTTPEEALRRLGLRGAASAAWDDIVRLDAGGIERVARAVDDERVALQDAYDGGGNTFTALTHIDELLSEADALAAANGRSGAGRRTRRDNQAKIQTLLEEIRTTAAEVTSASGEPLLDGNGVLVAGKSSKKTASLKLDRVALDALGRIVVNGRTLSLADVARRKPLDTSTGERSDVANARRALESAKETVAALKTKIQTFQNQELRPRLGDAATAMEGIFTSTSLNGSEEAMKMARELRTMMLQSATLATAIAADGWDRERTIGLLT
ncbi:MAG TPA: hypothetical protein VGR35_21575 [Tepidisphaeraceae bacterium]|nr:hypothetical protein [Tepidisphaeraceae bacterium]